jgi:hypothetical protein
VAALPCNATRTQAAIRWLRGHADTYNLSRDHVGAGGWSAGACTTAHLSSSHEADFTHEMSHLDDPTWTSLVPYLNESSLVGAGTVWAGNLVR